MDRRRSHDRPALLPPRNGIMLAMPPSRADPEDGPAGRAGRKRTMRRSSAMAGVHLLDRFSGSDYPSFATEDDVRAFEQVPYRDRIAAESTYDAIKLAAARYPDAPAIQFLANADPADVPDVITYRDFVARLSPASNMFHAL